MTTLTLLRTAISGVTRQKLRSLLTALGIIIGVGAFITMMAVGRGASHEVQQLITGLGANTLTVEAEGPAIGGVRLGGTASTLTDGDVLAIRRECDNVKAVSPRLTTRAQVAWGGSNWNTSVMGISPEYFEIRAFKVASGIPLNQRHYDLAEKVCVIGSTVAAEVFGPEEPLGQTMRVGSTACTVVGVLGLRGASGDQDQDDRIFMPVTSMRAKLVRGGALKIVERIYIQAQSSAVVPELKEQVQKLLRQRHNTAEGDPGDPRIRDMTEIAQAAEETTATLTLLLAGIAAVSLVVGGVGIMNIMLVSVTERTREIGIRLAVGARSRFILAQFLLESLLLTLLGGLTGMAAGTAGAKVFADQMGWPTMLDRSSYGIALGFATFIGLSFGLYPAWRASRLDPIEALRSD